jgi:hypothetical protein
LAFFSQPWELQNHKIQPRQVASTAVKQYSKPTQPFFRVADLISFSRGWLKSANPGLKDNPFGIHTAIEFPPASCPGELIMWLRRVFGA